MFLSLLLLFLPSGSGYAAGPPVPPPAVPSIAALQFKGPDPVVPAPPAHNDGFGTQAILGAQDGGPERSDSLSFDDELIEGMNQNPFESLTNVGKKDDRDEGHLYHRKPNFRKEIRRTSQEMGYVQ